jgi:hypothetical protein
VNERIKELINQAMQSTGVEGLGGSYMELNPEKFAELIIRECMEQVKDFYLEDSFNFFNAAEAIKDHFGVKE